MSETSVPPAGSRRLSGLPSPGPDVLIRDVTLDDASGIVGILNPIIGARVYTALDTPLTAEEEHRFIQDFSSRGLWKVAVAREDGRMLGFQVLEPFGPYTRAFDHVATLGTYVDLAERRRGIARALFSVTIPAARDKGFEKIFTFVRADNPAALATYTGQGFTIVGVAKRHAKIDGRYIDEILIERTI